MRHIAVMPVVAKVFKRIIYEQLYLYKTMNSFLTCYQSCFLPCTPRLRRGGSRVRVRGGGRTPPLLPEMTCGFLIQLVFYKKNYVVYWCWSRARDKYTPSLKKSWIRLCYGFNEATDSWNMNIDSGLVNVLVFLDLIKAFDTVDHDIFFRILPHYRIPRI